MVIIGTRTMGVNFRQITFVVKGQLQPKQPYIAFIHINKQKLTVVV